MARIILLSLALAIAGCGDYTPPPTVEKPKPVQTDDSARINPMNARSSEFEGLITGEIRDVDLPTKMVRINLGFGTVEKGWKFEVRRKGAPAAAAPATPAAVAPAAGAAEDQKDKKTAEIANYKENELLGLIEVVRVHAGLSDCVIIDLKRSMKVGDTVISK
jgi:hypothetical protein